MKSISKEIREIIISANERGEKPRTISIWTKVCLSSVYNIIAMHKKTNSIAPKPHIGRPSKITKEIEIKIREKIKEKNDITLEELIMPQLKNYLHENEQTLPKSVLFLDSQSSTKWLKSEKLPFDFAKSIDLIKYVLETSTKENDIILDFFSGSATTAHAVMQLNAEDGGNHKFIYVQLPEITDEESEAHKAGYGNICEIGKERIRYVGTKIKSDSPLTTETLDT